MLTFSVHAVTVPEPGAISEQSKKTLDYYEFKKRIEKTDDKGEDAVVDETVSKKSVVPQSTKKIHVNNIVTNKSEILTSLEIRELVAPYEGKDITITELFSVIEKINQLYKDKNHLSAKAILPPQKVEVGVINIKLVESHVGEVIVENNENTKSDYILNRVNVDKESLVRLDHLENKLFYFNSVNDVKIRAVLKPGKEFATTDYILQVEEPLLYYTTLFVDNSGTDDTGNERIGATFVNNSLTGGRDVFTAGANFTQGVKSSFVSYNHPVGRKGARVGLSADYSEVSVISGPLETLNIEGSSFNIGGFVTQPIKVEKTFLLNAFAGLNKKNSSTDFDGVKIFDTDVATISLGVDSQHYQQKGPLYSRHVLTMSDEGLFGADQRFSKYNGELSKIIVQDRNVVTLYRASAQFTNHHLLPSSEQFQIGGMSTVRGYPSGLLTGDKGYFASVEISFPMVAITEQSAKNPYMDKWRGLMFVDHGGAFPFKGNNTSTNGSDYITSVGIGLNVNFSKQMSARLVLAEPIKERDDGEDNPMLHFYISYIVL